MSKTEQLDTIISLLREGKDAMALTCAWSLPDSDYKARIVTCVSERLIYRLVDIRAGVEFGEKNQ